MASFEAAARRGSSSPEEIVKYPLKRVEPAIRKFIKVTQIDLDRLKRHHKNIQQMQALGNTAGLHKEHIKSALTVKQITANIRQLQGTREQVLEEDLEKFNLQVRDIHQQAVDAVAEFLTLHGGGTTDDGGDNDALPTYEKPSYEQPSSDVVWLESQASSAPLTSLDSNQEDQSSGASSAESPLLTSPGSSIAGSQLPPPPTNGTTQTQSTTGTIQTQAALQTPGSSDVSQQSWRDLHSGLKELNSVIHDYADLVNSQQEQVDLIEDNIESAEENVSQGTQQLAIASKLKTVAFPVAGALLGGAVGGPIGFVAGMKLGLGAAIGGGLAGYTGGKLLKKRQDDITNTEMQNLEGKTATLPENESQSVEDVAKTEQ